MVVGSEKEGILIGSQERDRELRGQGEREKRYTLLEKEKDLCLEVFGTQKEIIEGKKTNNKISHIAEAL